MDMKILIIGANGFIGSHLTDAILKQSSWSLVAFDQCTDYLESIKNHPRLLLKKGDMRCEMNWLQEQIEIADVVIPLAAIATPKTYVKAPLQVFELDFEANLQIVRYCVKANTHLIFPSTSEVYGKCVDREFDEDTSDFITGPLHKERWIYASAKQLMDRIIYAYGQHEGLRYTLFRPFNWFGPRLDDNVPTQDARVLTQFINTILKQNRLTLVDGGLQQRSFTYISDGIDALLKIITHKNTSALRQIFNLGHPENKLSIKALLALILSMLQKEFNFEYKGSIHEVSGEHFYGAGYQDIASRQPSIKKAVQYLNWRPQVSLRDGLYKTLIYAMSDEKRAFL